ncbi:MAG: DUF5680 domain-containing protein [Candidatus Nealsonbacteria bacterium]
MDRTNLTKDDVGLLESFYLEAMRHGWAAGAKKVSISELPGAKAIPYRDEKKQLYLLDWYFAPQNSLNGASAGTTMIWYKGIPVWLMHYGGRYRKEATPFLKAALTRAYELPVFWGGRGLPYDYQGGERLVYINQTEKQSSFADFRGEEMIIDLLTRTRIGWHTYWGTLL